jgi:hypothetical protein
VDGEVRAAERDRREHERQHDAPEDGPAVDPEGVLGGEPAPIEEDRRHEHQAQIHERTPERGEGCARGRPADRAP